MVNLNKLIASTVISFAVFVASCSPQLASDPAAAESTAGVHPVSGLRVVPLTVASGDQRHLFQVEVAATAQEQSKGLMFRTELGPNEGMIFPRNPTDIASFWMKNTPLPLDIIFVGMDGEILNIAANTVPYSLDPVSSKGMTALVFEIAGGRAEELGIKAGDIVQWQR
ncbi:hypothetical protein GCM10023115_56180 [Pontixanthobacter gangjinensis]|uniref:DUF192 domain-containing protein n=1 Tax=Pontixanthobacter gangjinensis TaxID=1028742 RepID=A0A6I4SPR6_9SPHN|nr:DUF192 domain-containing protein [Pontixanthobacter gangjinensis]MXO57901.1 DUF192 domain-containing protein [Pontixanthobacter gangjinensis]